jgi:SNF2 family DNA or RNA helicase
LAVARDYRETPAKILALDEIFRGLIESNAEKVVLWSFYRASLDALFERYGKYGAVRYDGTVTDVDDRRESVRKFQEDDETMLFIGNPAAAGAGLTLHRARYAIYESLSNQAAHYLQSIDRIHRRGQERDVEYLVLLCQDTIEVREYERLVQKERLAQELLKDDVEEAVTRETLLSETIALLKDLGEGL